jgi:hypothetical protein
MFATDGARHGLQQGGRACERRGGHEGRADQHAATWTRLKVDATSEGFSAFGCSCARSRLGHQRVEGNQAT